jgi:hypothetical protein
MKDHMGYLLSSLAQLPIESNVNFYIFVINGGWSGGYYEIIERNFAHVAKVIGPMSVIAKGFDEEWSTQVAEKYLGQDHSAMSHLLPALLITDTHPEQLSEESMRILVPLNMVEEFGGVDKFFTLLARFVRDRDPQFLSLFQEVEKPKENIIEAGASMLELKPNICGIGFNINEVIRRLSQRKQKTA